MSNKHFIKTSDEATALMLRKIGLQELSKEGNKFVFINEPNKIQFSSDNMKMNFTDVLTF